MIRTAHRLAAFVALVAFVLVAAGCGDDDTGSASDADSAADGAGLTGVLTIDAGACDGDVPEGSWFQMVQPGGTQADGPFVDNPDSPCADTTLTPLSPGTDGGISLGSYQPQPDPAFGEGGVSNAGAIITPAPFFAVAFGLSTNEVDPQTGETMPAPTASADGEALSADVRALSVSWNEQHFNQGAMVTGTYDAESGTYSLEWTATIVGGPFNNFTGIWHLEGTLQDA